MKGSRDSLSQGHTAARQSLVLLPHSKNSGKRTPDVTLSVCRRPSADVERSPTSLAGLLTGARLYTHGSALHPARVRQLSRRGLGALRVYFAPGTRKPVPRQQPMHPRGLFCGAAAMQKHGRNAPLPHQSRASLFIFIERTKPPPCTGILLHRYCTTRICFYDCIFLT